MHFSLCHALPLSAPCYDHRHHHLPRCNKANSGGTFYDDNALVVGGVSMRQQAEGATEPPFVAVFASDGLPSRAAIQHTLNLLLKVRRQQNEAVALAVIGARLCLQHVTLTHLPRPQHVALTPGGAILLAHARSTRVTAQLEGVQSDADKPSDAQRIFA